MGGRGVVYIVMSPALEIWFHARGAMSVIKPIGALTVFRCWLIWFERENASIGF